MKRFYLFRSNLRIFEYYHKFKDLETFRKNCHDYYLLFSLWLLEKNYFDEVVIWRLHDNQVSDIVFEINGKQFIQRWVHDFQQVVKFPSCDISFWRGGFPEYDSVTKKFPKHFGFKIYLGAGKRVFSQWNGKYDLFLVEDEQDINNHYPCALFYKTASPFIFFPKPELKKKWDICWPCNFTQLRYKGQEEFIRLISKSDFLAHLKIVHCGNKTEVGQKLCQKYGVNNISFLGYKSRNELNTILNCSKLGLNYSNHLDGCPRVSTEILMSGTPLLISKQTRLLDYYKKFGVVVLQESDNPEQTIKESVDNYNNLSNEVQKAIRYELSFDTINEKNIREWLSNI